MIHWELYKEFKFDYTDKWYLNKPESVPGEQDAQNPMGFWDKKRSPNLD